MKTLSPFYLFIFIMCMVACEDPAEKPEPFLTMDVENNVYLAGTKATTAYIKIHTNLPKWEVIPKNPEGYKWCKSSVSLSASGFHMLTLSISSNEEMEKREAEFIIRGNGIDEQVLKVIQLGAKPQLLADVESKLLSNTAQTFDIQVTANIEYTAQNTHEWLTLKKTEDTKGMASTTYQYEITANNDLLPRMDTICFTSTEQLKDTLISVKIPVEQKAADLDDVMPEDIKLKIESVTMVQGTQYGQQKPELTIDGNYNTFYGSGNFPNKPAVIFEYTLAPGIEKVDYVMLYPRPDRPNLTRGTIEYKSETVTEWTKCGEFDIQESNALPIKVNMENAIAPTHLRLTLERKDGIVSLIEFECYQSVEKVVYNLEADAAYFDDDIFSKLKPTTVETDIPKITHPVLRAVAYRLLQNTYSEEFRVRTYKSCQDPRIVGKELTIGKRSICDNSMGLFFEQDKKYVIFVGEELGDHSLTLSICDWREDIQKRTISLEKGMNVIKAEISGNGYIQYWTETAAPNPDVRIHVCLGNEIGFWDVRAGHNNTDWKRILKTAKTCAQELNITNAMIDVAGEYVQLINTVEAFNTYCPYDIEKVLAIHDEMLLIEYTMMGLVKYNAVPHNRMLGVRSWGGSPNWNGTCANFPNNERAMLTPAAYLDNIWLFAHEFGHGNQIRQMNAAGWAEVTNNLYGQQAMYLMVNGKCRIEHVAFKRQEYDQKVTGDLFNTYLNEAIVEAKPYLTHGGKLTNDPEKGEYYGSNPFVTLAPLWQLSLFYMLTEDAPWSKPDFWPDVHWDAIHDPNPVAVNGDYGPRYVRFMKRAMEFSGYNMNEFFERMGLLREIDMKVGDYGPAKQITITKAMVDEVKAYGETKLPAPTPVIHYISANSLQTYRQQLPLEGTFNEGVTPGDLSVTVSHAVWKNAVAFETYAGDTMVDVCIAGTGSDNNSSTFIRYPEEATRIEAVGWDGERKLVFGNR